MFGGAGTRFLSWTKDYKRNKEEKNKQQFLAKCHNPNLTPSEAYKLVTSKCWNEYHYWLEDDRRGVIRHLYHTEYEKRAEEQAIAYGKQQERKRKLNEQYDSVNTKMAEIKDYKAFTYISYVVVALLAAFVLYCFYLLIMLIPFHRIDWPVVGEWVLYMLAAAAIIGGLGVTIYGLVRYVFGPFFRWLSCIKLPSCRLCNGMKNLFANFAVVGRYFLYIFLPIWWLILGIGKVGVIIGHMIYSTYKKQCPIIEWKED
jgi:hypothetical protein